MSTLQYRQENTPIGRKEISQRVRWAGYLMSGWSFLFALLHFAWAAGWQILTDKPPDIQIGPLAWMVCTVVLGIIIGLTALAVVQSGRQVIPPSGFRASILVGTGLVFLYAAVSFWINGPVWILAAGVLCVVGGVVGLALTQQWGQQVPRWIPLLYAWAGGIVLTLHALYGIVAHGMVLAGIISWSQIQQFARGPVTALSDQVVRDMIINNMLIWNPWFLAGGTLYLMTAWKNSRSISKNLGLRPGLLLLTLAIIVSACTPAQKTKAPVDLAGTRWALVSMGKPGEETPVIEGSNVTLEFGEDGQVGGSGGCNSYGGKYQVEGETVAIREIESTLIACADQTVTEQEAQVLQALQTASRFTLADDQLDIYYDNGANVLRFTDVEGASAATEQPSNNVTDAGLIPTGPDEKQYALTAEAGQTIMVEITSDGAPLSLTIKTPSGIERFPEVAQDGSGFRISHSFGVTETGEYQFTLTKADQTPSTNYTATFTVQ